MYQTAEEIVKKNVAFYNKRDIEGFISTFSDEIVFSDFPNNNATLKGIDQVRKYYNEVFETSPNLYSTIVNRVIFNNKVIDHESIIGRKGTEETFEIVLIYEVKENKIYKVTAIRN